MGAAEGPGVSDWDLVRLGWAGASRRQGCPPTSHHAPAPPPLPTAPHVAQPPLPSRPPALCAAVWNRASGELYLEGELERGVVPEDCFWTHCGGAGEDGCALYLRKMNLELLQK